MKDKKHLISNFHKVSQLAESFVLEIWCSQKIYHFEIGLVFGNQNCITGQQLALT